MEIFTLINSQFSFTAQVFLVAIFGLIFGSFITLLSQRLVSNQKIGFARSSCPKCHFTLKIRNLVPLLSWIFQGGKCSNCAEKISLRYPLIELSCAISFVIIFFALDKKIDERLIILCLIAATLILMIVTDLEHYLIPDFSQYLLAILVIILRIHDEGTYGAVSNIKSAFCYMGFGLLMLVFFYIVTKIEAVGVDDIKFFFIAGLMLGMNNFLFFMLASGIFGSLFGASWQAIKKDKIFPFAPAICLSFYICMLFGNKINPVEIFGSLVF